MKALLSETFTEEYLQKLDLVAVKIINRVKSGYFGSRKASGKGNSLEFSDYRQYALGDDLRRIDWNSFARLDKMFVKLYTDEKQATVNIFIDTSRSMDYGFDSKKQYAKILACSIAYIFIKNTDRVSIFSCGESIEPVITGISTKSGFSQIISRVEGIEFTSSSGISSLVSINVQNLNSGLSYVISDFLTDSSEEAIKALQYKNQQITLLHVLAQEEVMPEMEGKIRLVDSETQDFKNIALTPDLLDSYSSSLAEFRARISGFSTKRGFGYVFANTKTHALEVINAMF